MNISEEIKAVQTYQESLKAIQKDNTLEINTKKDIFITMYKELDSNKNISNKIKKILKSNLKEILLTDSKESNQREYLEKQYPLDKQNLKIAAQEAINTYKDYYEIRTEEEQIKVEKQREETYKKELKNHLAYGYEGEMKGMAKYENSVKLPDGTYQNVQEYMNQVRQNVANIKSTIQKNKSKIKIR